MSVDALDAHLYGVHVARVRRLDRDRVSLTFTADATARWGHGSAVLSALLPLAAPSSPPPPARARVWLSGLLPEGRARTRLAERAGVDPDDLVGFLAVYGRDTAGAVVLVPAGDDPSDPGLVTPVTMPPEQVGRMLDDAAAHGAADQLTSIGGLEAKVALTETPDGFGLPTPSHPSTHIIKLSRPAGSLSADLVDTECATLDLARRTGLGDVEAHLADFAGRRAIVVRRYDRTVQPHGVGRVHQEDFAQALGIDTRDPDRKFQHGRRLPSLAAVAAVLETLGVDPTVLLRLTAFNLAVGNTDAHVKNLSLVHHADGGHALAPAYDVAMHTHHDHADRRFAMDLLDRRDMAELNGQDLVEESARWGLTRVRASRAVHDTLERLLTGLAHVDRGDHPGVTDRAWSVVEQRAARLLATTPAARPSPSRRAARPEQPRAPRGTPTGGRFVSPRARG